ncbi:hypothetical protein SAY86_016076 [Trapa natans]|uniref:SKP1 component POZ domain-containing protein n=1 Tax=Trapa natans TaxID=22666 RepID=A0AAN7LCD4_TRANT|nr:hypothetical protein SAY86_016076 [Trapa natans]
MGVNFEVDEIVAMKSGMINDIIEHCCMDGDIPLPFEGTVHQHPHARSASRIENPFGTNTSQTRSDIA